MLLLEFIIFLSGLTTVHTEVASTIVHVNSQNDNKECTYGEDAHCSSVEKACELVSGQPNVKIIIESDCILTQEISFVNMVNVTLIGSIIEGRYPNLACEGRQAGIYIENTSSMTISSFTLKECAMNNSGYLSAIMFNNSFGIAVSLVKLTENPFSAITLLDCYNTIHFMEVIFSDNGKENSSSVHRAGALNIEVISGNRNGYYSITNCTFLNNTVIGPILNATSGTNIIHWGKGRLGGGMRVIFAGNHSHSHSVIINGCNFSRNYAHFGGGLYIQFQDECTSNIIEIYTTLFFSNSANESGGALNVNFIINRKLNNTNRILLTSVRFISNIAKYGGAVSATTTYSDFMNTPTSENLVFCNCTWDGNTAKSVSPAVDISPHVYKNSERYGYLSVFKFHNIEVLNNHVKHSKQAKKTHHKNSGVFLAALVLVHFSGYAVFENNSPSALQGVSSGIRLLPGTTMRFVNNSGVNGASIALYGYSSLYLSSNVSLEFINNTASNQGAGIYYHGIDQHEFFTGYNCFIETKDEKPSITFVGNNATRGSWIYAESFFTCLHHCRPWKKHHNVTFDDITECLWDSALKGNNHDITTSAHKFKLEKVKSTYEVIPGNKFNVPFTVDDELQEEVFPLMSVTASNTSSGIKFEKKYTTNGDMVPLGPENRETEVVVTVINLRTIFFKFTLRTTSCPPGHIFTGLHCQCGNKKSNGYYQIEWCDSSNKAVMSRNYWAGYIPQTSQNYKDLYFITCLPPICMLDSVHLPNDSKELSGFMCSYNRKGLLCGKCVDNHSMAFNSESFLCTNSRYCHFGIIFYILSEIVPTTVLFLVVIVFDMTFTSGGVVGFIFFSQYLQQLVIEPENIYLRYIRIPYKLYYGIFNLEYFNTDQMSYCLWKGLEMQDIIAIKYVSIIYTLALVMILIGMLKSGRCSYICNVRRKISNKNSFIRGLSAFLAISYIQCTKTSFLILSHRTLQGLKGQYNSTRYTYYGGVEFFKGKHLIYSTIAILSLFFISTIPPLILLLHPLLLQLLSLCGLSEHRITLNILKKIRFNKLVPFIDCFQSCYKDQLRFFSGLYYVYRVVLLVCYSTSNTPSAWLYLVQFFLLLFIGIHSLVQPYKEQRHNMIDTLIFLNLSVINLLNIAIDNISLVTGNSHQNNKFRDEYFIQVVAFQSIQTLLMYLPMIVTVAWVLHHMMHCSRKSNKRATEALANDKMQEDYIMGYDDRNDTSSSGKPNTSELSHYSN